MMRRHPALAGFGEGTMTIEEIVEVDSEEGHVAFTGEQFAWHCVYMMKALLACRSLFVRWLEKYPLGELSGPEILAIVASGNPAGCSGPGCWAEIPPEGIALGGDELQYLIDRADVMLHATAEVFGDDWETVFVDRNNAAALAYRLGKVPIALARAWYDALAASLKFQYLSAKLDEQYREDVARLMPLHTFWGRIAATVGLTADTFGSLVAVAADFGARVLAAAAEAAGGALGTVAGGVLSGVWKAVKPLVLPTVIVGGLTLGGLYLWRRHSSKFVIVSTPDRQALPPARDESTDEEDQ